MSWQATTAVTNDSKHKGSELLCMLMLANYADNTGHNVRPSIPTLARDCRMSERATRYIVKKLVESGELVEEGTHTNNIKVYSIALQSLQPCKVTSTAIPRRQALQSSVTSPAKAIAGNQSGRIVRKNSHTSAREEDVNLFGMEEVVSPAIPFNNLFPASIFLPLTIEEQTKLYAAWRAFVEDRKERKKALTTRAAQIILNRLAEQPKRAAFALMCCIEKRWLSFEWLWLDNKEATVMHRGTVTLTPSEAAQAAPRMLSGKAQRELRRANEK